MDDLTVCIPTHALKVEKIGPYKDYGQKNYTAPSTKLIETSMSSVREKLNEFNLKFIISLDHKLDNELSCEYLTNLKKLENETVRVGTVDSNLSENVLTTVTATKNFYNLVDLCDTEYFLMWEHDWIFFEDVDNKKLKSDIPRVDMIRFNQHVNKTTDWETIWNEDDLLLTDFYCNNPFITSRNFWYNKIVPIANEIPDWWGEYGAFIEGPMKRYRDDMFKSDETRTKYLNEYRISLYGNLNDESVIRHLNGQVWS